MTSPNLIRYDFATITDAVTAMRRAIADVRQEMGDLRNDLQARLQEWQGQGDESFQRVENIWQAASGNLNDAGRLLTETLDRVNAAMMETDSSVSKLLQSHSLA